MRLAVDIDATAPEGPVALEIVADRLPSLDAASALLGIALIRALPDLTPHTEAIHDLPLG